MQPLLIRGNIDRRRGHALLHALAIPLAVESIEPIESKEPHDRKLQSHLYRQTRRP